MQGKKVPAKPTAKSPRLESKDDSFHSAKCSVISNITSPVSKDQEVRKAVGTSSKTAIIDRITRHGETALKYTVQFTRAEIVDAVQANWPSDSFGGSQARKPIHKDNSEATVGFAKHVPIEISEVELNTTDKHIYADAKCERLKKNRATCSKP